MSAAYSSPGKIVVAKTGLDGHWRGVTVVAHALRDAGFEVVMLGMATAEEIAAAALQEDADLVGLNVGGRIEVLDRVIAKLREVDPDLPILAGGTIAPPAAKRLREQGIGVFPPGSALPEIVTAAHQAIAERRARDGEQPA
jgi:methylmalonyl-CoA mutase, C-terminal domain